VSTSAMGKVGNDGLYEVADWDTGRKADGSGIATEEEILAKGRQAYPALFGNSLGTGSKSCFVSTLEPVKRENRLDKALPALLGSTAWNRYGGRNPRQGSTGVSRSFRQQLGFQDWGQRNVRSQSATSYSPSFPTLPMALVDTKESRSTA
jgi:hypothetical protein